MARKLPWSGGDASAQTKIQNVRTTRPERPPKREKDEDGVKSTPRRKRAASRSPSTSPPPGPPDVEPMLEGFDADDGFIMVEDEFQTVAQSFTGHLHHAEYKRLMKKARETAKKTLPELTPGMSFETTTKLKGEKLRQKQKDAVDGVTGKINLTEDQGEDFNDPWSGTSLAGLMTSSSQQKTSLKGLERMSSNTRAAKGFGRTGDTPEKTQKIIDIFSEYAPAKSTSTRTKQQDTASQDDLQASSTQIKPMPRPRQPDTQQHGSIHKKPRSSEAIISQPSTSVSKSRDVVPAMHLAGSSKTTGRTAPKRGTFKFDDGFDESMVVDMAGTMPIKKEHNQDSNPSKPPNAVVPKEDAKDQKKRRLDEVPIFIV